MKTVVIADDDKLIRDRITYILKNSDIDIDYIINCKNGREAYDIINTKEVNVLITDIDIPLIDGLSLIKNIKKQYSNIKVIIISSNINFCDAVNCLKYGVRDYLIKPLRKDDLINCIKILENEYQNEKSLFLEKATLFYEELRYNLLYKDCTYELYKNIKNKIISFVFICTNYFQVEHINDNFLFFKDILGHNVILTTPEYAETLINKKLKGFGIGISSIYYELSDVHIAMEEAIEKRKKSFFLLNIESKNTTTFKDIDKKDPECITHLIGTARIEYVYLYLQNLINKVKFYEIDFEEFEKIIIDICKKINDTYKEIIEEKKLDIQSLFKLFMYTDINRYCDDLFKLLDTINNYIMSRNFISKNRSKIEEALKYIGENYKSEINMTIVSNYVSMNYSVFSINFKEYTGKSFATYLRELRLKEAKRLLNETDMKVIEISEAVGYDNDKHFLKTFKKMYSVTPSEYRKNIKNRK